MPTLEVAKTAATEPARYRRSFVHSLRRRVLTKHSEPFDTAWWLVKYFTYQRTTETQERRLC